VGGDAEKVGHSGAAVVVCASGGTLEGIDVSEFQGSIDWNAVHGSGRAFAIARVSDGTQHPDPTFATNWAGIKAAGMTRGVYQFFRASEDPVAQADLLLNAVGTLDAADLSPVADVEVTDGVSGDTLVANLAAWTAHIQQATGRVPMIYTAPGFWDPLPSTGQFGGDVLWVANWQVNCPDTPTPWSGWTFWQYADNGNVPGISGNVDLDQFNGTTLPQGGGGPDWAGAYVSQSFPLASTAIQMTAGDTLNGYIELKNTGTKTWDGSTHLGTTQPRDRTSVFADSTWLGPNRPAGVSGTVAPGSSFRFTFNLHAPSTPGTYYEYFGVVEEGVAWFSDTGQGGPPDDQLEVQVSVAASGPPVDAGNAGGSDGGGGAHRDAGNLPGGDGGPSVPRADAAVPHGADSGAGAGGGGAAPESSAPASSDSSGCGCHVAKPTRATLPMLAASALVVLLARRRRSRSPRGEDYPA
jgi:lysozyme